MGRKLQRRHCRKHLVLLAALLAALLSTVTALAATLLAAVAATGSVLAALRRTPGCAAAAALLAAVTFCKMLVEVLIACLSHAPYHDRHRILLKIISDCSRNLEPRYVPPCCPP
jgi:hypothetical protein